MRISSLEKLLKKKYCMLTKSGSTAIYILIKSLNIKKKFIIVPANICFDVVLTILFTGNKPLVLDIDKNYCLSYNSVKKYRNIKKVGAIIYPYMFGNYGDVFKVKNFAKKKNIYFIEDVAPSLGLKFSKKYAGNISDYSFCSFGTGKILDMKMGGSLNVNSVNIYKKAENLYSSLRILSQDAKKKYIRLNNICEKIIIKKLSKKKFGLNSLKKYENYFAAKYYFNKEFIKKLNYKISKINKINSIRNTKANMFQKIIKNKKINFVKHKKGAVYWRQNALVKNKRDKLIQYLRSNKIYARRYFSSLDSIFPFISNKNLKFAKKLESQIINFWVGVETTKKDIVRTNIYINRFFSV